MNILSIQLGHNATALLMIDGRVARIASQEKFDNIKNSSSFPHDAIKWLLSECELASENIDKLVICGQTVFPVQSSHLSDSSVARIISDDQSQLRRKLRNFYGWLDYKFGFSPWFKIFKLLKRSILNIRADLQKKRLLRALLIDFGFCDDRIEFVEHHICHAFSPLFFFGAEKKDWLVLTMDGAGDESFATANTFKDGRFERLSESSWEHSLGYVYSKTTQFLGMRALEHEYKVMGIAAYGKPEFYLEIYNRLFQDIAYFSSDDALQFKSKFPLNRFDRYLREHAVGERFDNISAALQFFLEDLVTRWVVNAITKTGIRNVMFSGGVFMNVKLNKAIQELDLVNDCRFMPSCGDESNPFGAAFFVAFKNGQVIRPVNSVYLGHRYSAKVVSEFIEVHRLRGIYDITWYENVEHQIAKMLAEFQVVARFAGASEWGARSLGNRAILANPSSMRSFYVVNDQVKARDFWMPFAPSILVDDADKYILNFDGSSAPYMNTAFDTTAIAQDHLRAAMHQGDKTIRPQLVTLESNEPYYKLIKEFKALTGIGGILNTSLNIHHYPLASTLEQALFTFENSGLQHLAVENFIISKPRAN